MEELIDGLYAGGDEEYQRLKNRSGWSFLRCCKEGPDGHRELVGYKTMGAPKGDKYLSVKAHGGKVMALNFVDSHDPHFVPVEMVKTGLKFIDDRLRAGDKVLVCCNQGESRGPITAMLYIHSKGEFGEKSFSLSERLFRVIYPRFNPGMGVRQFARTHWRQFSGEDLSE